MFFYKERKNIAFFWKERLPNPGSWLMSLEQLTPQYDAQLHICTL